MTQITIQPAQIDAWLNKNAPTTNYGSAVDMYLNGSSTYNFRPIMKFDLSSIPPSVTSAKLYIYCKTNSGGGHLLPTLHRVLRPWTSAGVDWNKYDGTNNWGTAGCDNTSTDRSSVIMGSQWVNATGWHEFELVLSEFWSMQASNNGMILLDVSGTESDKVFHSSNYVTDTSLCPKLIVVYTDGQFICWSS